VSKAPVLKPREVVALLGKLGFVEVRQRGSHQQFRHVDGRCTTVPFHQGRDIAPTLLRQIAKDIGLSVEELLTGQSGQQPDKTQQPTADDAARQEKRPEPGPG
jgi:predicted RNA binding protein YcfA (HicA-like mRNA interferase family)